MKTVRFAMFLFYRYYRSGRWESVPYFHTLSSMSFLLFLHVAALLCFLNKGNILFGNGKNTFVIRFLVLYGLSLFAFWRLAKKDDLEAAEYDETHIKRGNWLLLLYVAFSIAMMVLSIVK